MRIEFLGHAGFLLETGQGSLVIDPFLTGNEQAKRGPGDIKVDWILLTHGHGDHLGDALEISKNNGATIIAPFELATYCSQKGCETHPMHIGGAFTFPFGRVKLTPALHGSAVMEGDSIIYTGNPCGFLLNLEGRWIYHAGDTGLFMDMQIIPPEEGLDLAIVPIGDNFVMGPEDAAKAVEYLKPKRVIPMHYDTFPLIEQDPEVFASRISPEVEIIALKAGEAIEL